MSEPSDLPPHNEDDARSIMLELILDLAAVVEENVGLEDAEGFIAMMGARTGRAMDAHYREAAGVDALDPRQIAEALVDLKRRIRGGFSIESVTDDRIVLVNDRCPFGGQSTSLCMITSNLFGRIAADNSGYARIALPEAIARGDNRCRIVIDLRPGTGEEEGREYFG